MTRTEKWAEKRKTIDQANKEMGIFEHLRMGYERPKYEPKNAKGVKCTQGQEK